MNNIQKNIEAFLIKNKCYLNNDFALSEHKDICISKKKFCKFSLINYSSLENIKIINGKQYLTLEYALSIISEIKNYEVMEFQETFGLLKIYDTSNFKIAKTINIKIPLQILFTYSVYTFLQKNFNTLNLEVEDNFLKRFKNIHIENTKGPRVDIVINDINIVLEYNETHHLTYENITKDSDRNNLIQTLGYEVLIFSEGENPFIFFEKLKKIIKERQFLFDSSKLSNYIIDLFCSQGYDEELIKLLTKEQCDDIIDGLELNDIGMTPKNLTLSTLLNFIKCDDEEDIEEIKDCIDDLVYPYEENEENEILLSPKAFEELLSKIDSSKHVLILKIRELYIDIKNYFLKNLYDKTNKLLQIYKNTTESLHILTNHSYERGVKDSYTKCKVLQEKNSKLETELNTLKKLYKSNLPCDGRGIIKKEIIKDKNSLEIGKYIIPEIPEIIFTGNNDDYISKEEIKILHENNKNIYKKIKSLKKCITVIKEKINIQTTDNSLLHNIIIACKINYNIKKNKEKNILSSSDSDDENKIVNKKINKKFNKNTEIVYSSSDSDDGDKIINKNNKNNKNSILLSSESSDDERM